MKTNWSIIIMVVSLTFNLAVLGIFLYITAFGKAPFQAFGKNNQAIDTTPKLTSPKESGWVESYLKQSLSKNKPIIEQFQADRKQFNQTLMADKFDATNAKTALSKLLKSRSVMERTLGESLIEMRKQMTTAQAKQFFQRRLEREHVKQQMVKRQDVRRDRIRAFMADSLSASGDNIGDDFSDRRQERRDKIRKRLLERYRQNNQ